MYAGIFWNNLPQFEVVIYHYFGGTHQVTGVDQKHGHTIRVAPTSCRWMLAEMVDFTKCCLYTWPMSRPKVFGVLGTTLTMDTEASNLWDDANAQKLCTDLFWLLISFYIHALLISYRSEINDGKRFTSRPFHMGLYNMVYITVMIYLIYFALILAGGNLWNSPNSTNRNLHIFPLPTGFAQVPSIIYDTIRDLRQASTTCKDVRCESLVQAFVVTMCI